MLLVTHAEVLAPKHASGVAEVVIFLLTTLQAIPINIPRVHPVADPAEKVARDVNVSDIFIVLFVEALVE